jgi:lysyl-tRNA synthetase, class I
MGKEKFHWTDIAAQNVIRMKENKKEYIVESGITPSGIIHLGGFREAITQELVKKGLERAGKKVKFLYVWDDYDVLRKVPKGLPKQEMIRENLRKPVFKVPDPFGCHNSYAEHFEKIFEEEIAKVGMEVTFVYSHKNYLACEYAEEIKIALENTNKIVKILNQYRKEPLAKDWLPIFVFCEKCDRDTTSITWEKGYEVSYICECNHKHTIDFRKVGIVTLRWRVDWPMRWHHNKVDFESAGKDHFAAGGSVDTGRQIQKEIYKTEPPFGFMYEWIGIRGKGQFASSTGNVITLTDLLEVYEPEIVRYLFAGTRPNREFRIVFDVGILAIYEEYDRTERIYFGLEKVNEKKAEKNRVAYELSALGKIPKSMPYQPGFRHLTMLLQINNFNIDKVTLYFRKQLKNQFDKDRLRTRAKNAENWLKKYAPEEFKFTVQKNCQVTLVKQEKEILKELAEKLLERDWTDVQLHEEMYVLCTNKEFPPKDFFTLAYKVLINKDKGPRLASFILEIGKNKVAKLFGGV